MKRLETLIYGDWYAACFMRDCKNPAICGSYGSQHAGVCLRFKTTDAGDDRFALKIERLVGTSGRGPFKGWGNVELVPVSYERTPKPIDFFTMLGRIPRAALEENWFTDRAGNRSSVQHEAFANEDAWRQRYWQEFTAGVTTKLASWRDEEEYRLLYQSQILDLTADSPGRQI